MFLNKARLLIQNNYSLAIITQCARSLLSSRNIPPYIRMTLVLKGELWKLWLNSRDIFLGGLCWVGTVPMDEDLRLASLASISQHILQLDWGKSQCSLWEFCYHRFVVSQFNFEKRHMKDWVDTGACRKLKAICNLPHSLQNSERAIVASNQLHTCPPFHSLLPI